MSLEIEVDIIDKLFDEGIDLYNLEEKVEKLIKANNGLVRRVEQLETKHGGLTVSEKDNDLVSFIREEIKECDRISPFKDVDKVRMLKKSILEQLLLDYSAKECKHVDEL